MEINLGIMNYDDEVFHLNQLFSGNPSEFVTIINDRVSKVK